MKPSKQSTSTVSPLAVFPSLARDFWVRPSEKMVRLWCRGFADQLDFAVDYQPWVIASFSDILCVDEVYQGELALLLAVDPAAPDGDRLVGYTQLAKKVDHDTVRIFLAQLQAAGIEPDEVITDDSRVYPGVLFEKTYDSTARSSSIRPRTSPTKSAKPSTDCWLGPSEVNFV